MRRTPATPGLREWWGYVMLVLLASGIVMVCEDIDEYIARKRVF